VGPRGVGRAIRLAGQGERADRHVGARRGSR
jgi:hypothetical protein